MLRIATPATYWVLILIWTFVLYFYASRLKESKKSNLLMHILFVVLTIDAFRTLFESLYFGAWYTSLSGMLPKIVSEVLTRPEYVFIPKIINVIAGLLIVRIILFYWVPEEQKERARILANANTLEQQVTMRTEELSHANELLRQSNERHRALFSSVSDPVLVADTNTGILVECNEAAERYFKQNREQLIGMPQYDLHPPKTSNNKGGSEYFRQSVKEPGLLENVPVLNGNGEIRIASVQTSIFSLKEQELILSVFHDVTEKLRAENALKNSEKRFRRAIEQAPLPIMIHAEDGQVLTISRAWTELTGYTLEDIPTIHEWTQKAYGSRMEEVKAYIDTLYAIDERRDEGEFQINCSDGSQQVWFFFTVPLGTLPDGQRTVLSMAFDITEQKAKVNLVEQAREKYQQLYRSIRDAILIADTERRIIDMNGAFSNLFGYSLDDLKGKQTVTIYKNESEYIRLGEMIRQNDSSNENIVNVIQYRKKSGEVFSGETAVFKIYDTEGNLTGFMGLIRDVSEKESLEQQLAYAQKLEAIGQLAAGVAHEINTPIMYMSGNIKFLKGSFESISHLLEKQQELYVSVKNNQDTSSLLSDIEEAMETMELDFLLEETPRAIAQSQEGADRVTHIVQAMKKFSHMDMNKMTFMDINEALANTLTIASNEWKYDSEIVTNLAKGLPLVEGILGDFNQVLLNVLVNAAHANSAMVKQSGGRGVISISTALDGDFVKVSISDTGAGISPENQHKVFDPFFTTKEVGMGTGQGLSITYAIMQKHGGTITFTSEENKGTTFILRFPIRQKGQNMNDA